MSESMKESWSTEFPGKLPDRWPKDEKGEYEAPSYLKSCLQLNMEDTMTVSMLEAYGIPCIKMFPHYGGFGKLMIGISAEGVAIFVPESMREDAAALLEGEVEDDENV